MMMMIDLSRPPFRRLFVVLLIIVPLVPEKEQEESHR